MTDKPSQNKHASGEVLEQISLFKYKIQFVEPIRRRVEQGVMLGIRKYVPRLAVDDILNR